ncbi:MAG: CpXC domain-containing protein [Candidatus Marsarchaeota archaeon]|nr:CpXC domain-containing protein [Candidatus Marsarchaeota archaeon]
MQNEIDIACPSCGQSSKAIIWNSVNVSVDPELREKVLQQDINRFCCPACGAEAVINANLLYHDMERHFMVQLTYDETGESPSPFDDTMLRVLGEDFIFRVVRTYRQLIEKILIFQDGLDDRVIEVMKALVRIQNEDFINVPADMFLYEQITDGQDGKELHFVLLDEEARNRNDFAIPMHSYRSSMEKMRGLLESSRSMPELMEVDMSYALRLIQEISRGIQDDSAHTSH